VALSPADLLLTDRVALVTGAAAGIGAATALALARFGAHVAACDRDADGLEATLSQVRAQDRLAFGRVLDVRDGPAVEAFVEAAANELGPLGILVNNAGGTFAAPFVDVGPKGQAALVDENWTQVTSLIRAALPRFAQHEAAIVNVTSIEAHRAGPGYAIYSAMKAAVTSLTRSLALELGDRGIRVNCVAPDLVPTAASGPMPVSAALERSGDVDDVAAAVVFLAGRGARFVTGTTLHVDGGGLAAAGWRRDGRGGFTPA
jgi:NAD(P)-dependent dehydrogenase (short-subunit alcohol dehydrogenase family)